MGRPKRPMPFNRFMMIELPILGFLSGALLSMGVSLVQLNQFSKIQPEDILCNGKIFFAQVFAWSVSNNHSTCLKALPQEKISKAFLRPSPLVSQSLALLETATSDNQLSYNVHTPPPFYAEGFSSKTPRLEQVVDGVLSLIQEQNYPLEAISISLLDLTGNCCDYGQFQDSEKRYPASIVKLFWLVALYGQYEAGVMHPDVDLHTDDEELMVYYSNNGASSRVLDAITQTESGESLRAEELTQWIEARRSVNQYFRLANYPELNIAHKTFPIPDLALEERVGRDLQLATYGLKSSLNAAKDRNFLSTYAVARLLYEIETGQAVSREFSDRAKKHLKHSTDPAIWQYEDPNSIEGFFGEYLPADVNLYTKLGFTFDDGRQEAAIIESRDGKTRFILVVFANDPNFSDGESKIFPEIARYVYDQMKLRESPSLAQ